MPTSHQIEVHALEAHKAAGYAALVHRAVATTLDGFGTASYEVGIQLVPAAVIRRLNRDFRGVDEVTDVLSFAIGDEVEPYQPKQRSRYLGDIAICVERAEEQAATYGHPVSREMAYLAVHGTLHLLGHDHEGPAEQRTMRSAEESVMARIGEPEPHAGA